MSKKAPNKAAFIPGLRGKHYISADGIEVFIDGHRFKRTVIPSPAVARLKEVHEVDNIFSEIESLDQSIIEI